MHGHVGLRPAAERPVPGGDPGHEAADRHGGQQRVLDVEVASLGSRLQEAGKPHAEFLPQAHELLGVLRLEVLLLPLVDDDVLLVLDDDRRDALDDHAELLARRQRGRQRLVERLEGAANADLADRPQDLALVLEVGIDERLGDLERLGDRIERRRLVAEREKQLARRLEDAAAFEFLDLGFEFRGLQGAHRAGSIRAL